MKLLPDLLRDVARKHEIELVDVTNPTKEAHVRARYEFCWRAAKETKASIREVADAGGYKDAAGVSYAIARYADSINRPERTFSEARDGFKADTVDWRGLCRKCQRILDERKITQAEATRLSGRPRRVWANVLTAKSVSADDLLAIMVFLGLTNDDVVTEKAKERPSLFTLTTAD